MSPKVLPFPRLLLLPLSCCLVAATAVRAQQPTPTPSTPPAAQSEEVLRISTELIQTDVSVFDKQGKFVDNLRAEQFELRVDGKPQPLSFFERVTAGSVSEDAQLAAARGVGRPGGQAAPVPVDRGRVVAFFVDDLHLSAGSLVRARNTLLRFIDEQLGQNDQAIVVAASGSVGFLQQLTDEKAVLRAAVSRLNFRQANLRDAERPEMNVVQAVAIEQNDPDVVAAFVDLTMRENPVFGRNDREAVERHVRGRASQLLEQANGVATRTLASLRGVMRTCERFPGRKLLYFISDGFVVETRRGNITDWLRRVTDAAVRSGTVVYSLDARGLSAEAAGVPDAASGQSVDPTGRLARGVRSEVTAQQDPLYALAADTGGRALFNTNALGDVLTRVLKETSVYYLLAWKPERAEQRAGRFRRIEVSVKGRPELTVLVQRGFFNSAEPPEGRDEPKRKESSKAKAPAPGAPHKDLFDALAAPYPKRALPTSLTLNYADTPEAGTVLTASVHINLEASPPGAGGGAQTDRAEAIGAIYDDRGKVVDTFERGLAITPTSPANLRPSHRLFFTVQTPIKPGLYQVRVATRDPRTGRTGSAAQWAEVPEFRGGAFALSSVFLGTPPPRQLARTPEEAAQLPPVMVNPERRFARDAAMRFLLYAYNAARTTAAPDVAIQVQLFRDDQPVMTSPLRKMAVDGVTDLARIPYAAELSLARLPAGQYSLQLTAIDRVAKASATRRVKFVID